MVHNCDVVQDLLPLYIDDVCSGASLKMVQEHLNECEKCRCMLRLLARDTYAERNIPREEEVLKKTSLTLNRRAINSALGILGIIVYWLVYFWQENLAEIGDYQYFSYRAHEMYTIGLVVVPLVTFIWLLALLVKSKKQKAWRKHAAVLIILVLLMAGQIGFYVQQQGMWSTSTWTEIVEIPDDYHIVVKRWDGTLITLETSMQVTKLLQTDGTVYQISYKWNERNPDVGTVWYIEYAQELDE